MPVAHIPAVISPLGEEPISLDLGAVRDSPAVAFVPGLSHPLNGGFDKIRHNSSVCPANPKTIP